MDCTPLHIPFVDIELIRDDVAKIEIDLSMEKPGSSIEEAMSCVDSCQIFNCPWNDYMNDVDSSNKKCVYIDQAVSVEEHKEDLMSQKPDVVSRQY